MSIFKNTSAALGRIFDKLRHYGTISDAHLDEAFREIRIALIEADVSLPVIKSFIANIREKIKGQDLIKSIKPTDLIIKAVHDELVSILSSPNEDKDILSFRSSPPATFMIIGLQGSGKTTSSAKLANYLAKNNKRVLLVSLDIYRPAAQEQLEILAKKIGVDSLEIIKNQNVEEIVERSKAVAVNGNYEVVIYDTAGRTHIDFALLQELKTIKAEVLPTEILLVLDSLTGQDAINIATHFHDAVNITGSILTRIDADNRGGAALSLKKITGAPIKFVGFGEKVTDFEQFYADRMASRILGMGDVVSLVEKVLSSNAEDEMQKAAERMQKGQFDLNDYYNQINMIGKMGGFTSLLSMLPGFGQLQTKLGGKEALAEGMIKRQIYIIDSMTKHEKCKPQIINGSRRKRIALGSGTTVNDVNNLLKQFQQMSNVMKKMRGITSASGVKNAFRGLFG